MWQNLIETLDKLGAAYDNLTALGERKRNALVAVDMKGLSEVLDAEQLTTAKIQKLEQKRIEILQSLLKADANITATTPAKEFYRSAPESLQKTLLQVHERLSQNVDRALKIRDNNRILAQCALDAVQGQLNKLSGATVEPTYSGKGSDVVTHQKKFDFKA